MEARTASDAKKQRTGWLADEGEWDGGFLVQLGFFFGGRGGVVILGVVKRDVHGKRRGFFG